MKKFLITIITLFIVIPVYGIIEGTPAYTQIFLKDKKNHFTQWNIPADMPDVYYNSELGVVTIVDYANVTYYVTIYDDWWNAVITDTKPGGGTIDVSSLTSGDYTIEISTSWNHEYTGDFTVP
jgi:hypothetical protein